MNWTSIVSRTRGLSAHLLQEGALRAIEDCATLRELVIRLTESRYLTDERSDTIVGAREIELACRRVAADRLATLERWALDDPEMLLPFTLAEDLRSVRALVRGATAGVAADLRLVGLIPTRMLPVRALSHLASLDSVAAMGALLTSWRHPLANALDSKADRSRLDVLTVECRLLDRWAHASLRAAGRMGVPRSIEAYVADAVDLANATTARLVASQRAELPGSDLFVTGGALITRDDVLNAATRRDIGEMARRVHARRPGSAIDVALSSDSRRLEEEILAARTADARKRTREDALDAGVIALFLLCLRAEQERIIRTAWSCELGLRPRPVREPRVAA